MLLFDPLGKLVELGGSEMFLRNRNQPILIIHFPSGIRLLLHRDDKGRPTNEECRNHLWILTNGIRLLDDSRFDWIIEKSSDPSI